MSRSDVLVVGGGPAALAIAADLAGRGLRVELLAPGDPDAPWVNTYGIWADELEPLGLASLLAHRWRDTVSYFGPGGAAGSEPLRHGRDYGLFDKHALQVHWLAAAERGGVIRQRGEARAVAHGPDHSTVSTAAGERLETRLVVDASGHQPVLLQRPEDGPVAGQAAYGIVGRFSADPIDRGQFVFMDYRADHLSEAERRAGPPTFLYAMDLGDGVFFVEETSLALAPAVPFALLRERLLRRLAHRGVRLLETQHEEFCLFPMNPPLPPPQRLVGFGGAAAMVHPASGYLVGGLLRRAPDLAAAIAAGLERGLTGAELAAAAWQGLWPAPLRWKHAFFRFGLEKLMRFDEARLRHHFASFFTLPQAQWYGFLTNTLTPVELLAAMVRLYGLAPWDVRWGLMGLQGREPALLAALLAAAGPLLSAPRVQKG
ncbi:MAG: lycopene cyclase family protein [Synechococcaceae cyanobacterium]|nr:lycopene cyclase family protein [Synechococcaceae cyanobacterium]